MAFSLNSIEHGPLKRTIESCQEKIGLRYLKILIAAGIASAGLSALVAFLMQDRVMMVLDYAVILIPSASVACALLLALFDCFRRTTPQASLRQYVLAGAIAGGLGAIVLSDYVAFQQQHDPCKMFIHEQFVVPSRQIQDEPVAGPVSGVLPRDDKYVGLVNQAYALCFLQGLLNNAMFFIFCPVAITLLSLRLLKGKHANTGGT